MRPTYILIAEDDEDDQFLLLTAFKEIAKDLELVFVQNGIELLNHFDRHEQGLIPALPALLILDLNMPKKNGKEALETLIKKNYFSNFRTVIFSTTANDLERKRCESLGVKGFYIKPSNYPALISVVKEFVTLAGQSLKESGKLAL
jgi:CheY-like chemotaxis protein